jgi:SAM-dependent methyltransferase
MALQLPFSEYDRFAWFYNRHWGDFAKGLLPILSERVLNRLPQNARLLDLCCGTGQLARLLGDSGYQVTGLDGSAAMIRFARENAPESEFLVDDARTFRLDCSYDAVMSTYDSLNHTMTPVELRQVFENVFRVLEPGGPFFFDLNMEAAYRTRWNQSMGIAEDDHACVTQSRYDAERRVADFHVTMFCESDGKWERSDVTLRQRCYTAAEVCSLLEQAGFEQIEVLSRHDNGELRPFEPNDERAFFVCRQPLHREK